MFHEKLDVKLIRLVRDNPVLYDFNHRKYMDFNTREVTWQKIGDELRQSAADCKVRWINIRDVHRRILKKNLTDPVHPPRQYKYETDLAFMRPFYRDRVILTVEEEEEQRSQEWAEAEAEVDEPAVSDDSDVPIKKVKTKKNRTRKRKEPVLIEDPKPSVSSLNETQSSELDPTDPVDAFLLSIGATLKTFTPYHLNVAKSKIFAVVQEHDLQQIVQKQKEDIVKVSTTEVLYLDG
ncbi:uncharacterized protein LOC113497919 [Trichoplusia ni]|uniref:Uncharacterized protein LOC113497919 n=1 Tax=Trichoplusia ni TaxID=7111 RepID=A0A7E5VZK7_TRINI|nr:uncharacterized protein LOC113497919 [Trichoplusia ni]